MKQRDIKIQIERFLDAETTLEEEQMLYDFFAQDNIPDDLLPYREMFRDMGCLRQTAAAPAVDIKPKPRRWRYYGAAASVAALIVCGLFVYNGEGNDYAVAYVNDRKIVDDAIAVEMGTDAVSEIFNSGGDASEDLYDIFNPKQQ